MSNGFYLKMGIGDSSYSWDEEEPQPVRVGGPSEVWAVRTDREGNLKALPWNSNYYLYVEGEWVDGHRIRGADWNDYKFGSLICNLDDWDDDDFLFIIIDGVVVDSCPPYLSEECRTCTAQ